MIIKRSYKRSQAIVKISANKKKVEFAYIIVDRRWIIYLLVIWNTSGLQQ